MTLKLYFAPGACSFVPHTLLETAGASYEPVLVKLHKQENYTPEFKALNPRSQVPVLVDGDAVITTADRDHRGYLNDRSRPRVSCPAEPCWRAISLHDGQAQARAVGAAAQRAVEGLEHQLALGLGHARAGVLHLQQQHRPKGVGQHAHGDHAGLLGLDGV
jgi:glutaredoxin